MNDVVIKSKNVIEENDDVIIIESDEELENPVASTSTAVPLKSAEKSKPGFFLIFKTKTND